MLAPPGLRFRSFLSNVPALLRNSIVNRSYGRWVTRALQCVPHEAQWGPDGPGCCHYKTKEYGDTCDGRNDVATPDKDRGKDYNHSSFLDIIIAGLIGLRAAFGGVLTLAPLADETIDYFALDNLLYHGHNLTIAFDRAATRYAASGCKGLCVWVDGNKVAEAAGLAPINITLEKSLSPGMR